MMCIMGIIIHLVKLNLICKRVQMVQWQEREQNNVHNYTSDHWIALKCFSQVSGCCFDRGVWNRNDSPTASGRGHSTDSAREPGQKVHNYRSDRWIALKFFSRVSTRYFRLSGVESVRHADDVRSGPFHRQRKRTGSKGP